MDTTKKPIAIVTGGSSGIGFSISKELAKRGYNLLLISNQLEQLETSKEILETEFNIHCEILNLNLATLDAAQLVFDYCKANNLAVEVLVNNAGMLIFQEVIQTKMERIEAILHLHMHTPTKLCRLFGEEMVKEHKGHILNVASISAVMPYPGISLYGPSKAYLRNFSKAFRHEMRIYGVNVSAVFPGATETGLYDPKKINLLLAKRLGIMQSPEFVAKKAINGLFAKKPIILPGLVNKLTVWFLPFLPSGIIYLIHKKTGLVKKGSEALN